ERKGDGVAKLAQVIRPESRRTVSNDDLPGLELDEPACCERIAVDEDEQPEGRRAEAVGGEAESAERQQARYDSGRGHVAAIAEQAAEAGIAQPALHPGRPII